MPPIDGLIASRVGVGGFAYYPNAREVAPTIQNLMRDHDGSWRPRYGLDLLRAMPARIAMLHGAYQATTNKHMIYMLTQESKLYEGDLTAIGTATPIDMSALIPLANFNSEFKNAAVCVGTSSNPTATEKRLLFSFPGFGVANQQVYDQDGGKVTDVSVADVKGAPFTHGNTSMVVQKTTLAWSAYGDAYSWNLSTDYTYVPPEIGEGVAGVYWQNDISYVAGTTGWASITGSRPSEARYQVLNIPPIAGPAPTHLARCRDRIFYLASGPAIYMLGAGVKRIDEPIYPVLSTYGDASYFTLFYDPLIDCLCVTPLVDQTVYSGRANDTFLFNLTEERWIGTYRHADSTKGISKAHLIGPVTNSTTVPRNAPPFGAVVVAASDLLQVYDFDLYADDNSAGTATSFTCALEAGPDGIDQYPHVDKQLLDVYIDGSGTWTVKAKYRDAAGEAYTEVTLGTVAAPGWVYADPEMPTYKERIIRIEASSASNLRVRMVGIRERALGA